MKIYILSIALLLSLTYIGYKTGEANEAKYDLKYCIHFLKTSHIGDPDEAHLLRLDKKQALHYCSNLL